MSFPDERKHILLRVEYYIVLGLFFTHFLLRLIQETTIFSCFCSFKDIFNCYTGFKCPKWLAPIPKKWTQSVLSRYHNEEVFCAEIYDVS
jgi:hypothetical protein